jgi:palmitoyltransferase
VLLTINCPQTTNARTHNENHSESGFLEINWDIFILVTTYILLLVNFGILHGSDPGYITLDVLEQFESDDSENECFLPQVNNTPDQQGDGEYVERHNPDPLAKNGETGDPGDDEYFPSTRRKRCEVCNLSPPLRSHHCKICNKCVATFDHHCLFVGTCIGERNHCRFWTFLTLQCVGFHRCIKIVGSSRLGVTSFVSQGFQVSILRVVVAKLFIYPLFASALIMWVIHTLFGISGSTTFECSKGPTHIDYLKGTRETDFPFSNGCMKNIYYFYLRDDAASFLYRHQQWKPTVWQPPGKIVRDSEDWWNHPWQNKYWSCC